MASWPIPSVSLYILQSHPFILFVQPRRGLTRKLFSHRTLDTRNLIPRLALFSGPHSISILVMEYKTVLIVAAGFGIAAQLPYLHKLIHGYQTCKTCTRQVYLLMTIDISMAAESLLNDALDEDTLDNKSDSVSKVPFGQRATIYPDKVALEERGKILVIVSGTSKLQDQL
ncbi:hypothetical protein B0J14DRAFT_608589 [Halenospora varia]|nr:hypothetical protein B0J14DRAFT_608589 [Halenospora varia]